MDKMHKLQEILYERLHRRPPGIDKLDRLWEAAVLLPLVQTEEGIAVLFEERAHSLRRQPGQICFPGGQGGVQRCQQFCRDRCAGNL